MSSFAMILPRIVLVFVVIVQCVMSSVTNSTEEVEIKDPAKKVQPSFCPCLFDSRGFNCLTSKCTCSLASFGLNSTIFEAKEGRSSISSTALRPLLRRPLEHCKEADKIALFWRPLNNTFYYLIYHEVHSPPNHGLPYTFHETIPTRCGYEVLKDLTPNTLYSIELRSITLTNDGEIVTGRSPSLNRRTHPTYRVLNPVPRFYLKQWFLIENTYTALVGWNKDNDNGCFFYVVAFGSEDEDYQDFDIDNVWANRELNITQLQFGRNYSISISAIADIRSDDRREGPKEWLNITVPTCLQAYQNLQRCKPDPPENLTVVEKPVDSTDDELKLYNVSLYWNEPRFKPDFYAANLLIFDSNFTKFFLNISGENTHATFGNIQLTPEYEVHLIAYSIRGPSTAATIHRHFNGSVIVPFKSESVIPMELLLVVVVPLIVVILSALFTLNYCLGKRTRKQKREKYSKDLEEKAPSTITTISTISMPFVKNDEWEIGTTKLIIKDILGQGAFGVVRRGWYSNDNGQDTEVAIKMLRDNPTQEELRQFYQEIEIMKSVPPHPQLVALIGCVSNEHPLLVVEYCSKGDLQTYLRNAYEKLSKAYLIDDGSRKESLENTNYAFNKLYDFNETDLDDLPQPKDLISFARQVAIGMEHLSSLKLIHRDLAARNILVCDNKNVKISDFGLSRDVYYDNVYCKLGGGKLPIRWMALESMTHQIYTTQSDVWSFGILMWEIVTLGSTPYPGIATHDLLALLNDGYRMKKPDSCSDELYTIMCDCWKNDPNERPSFLHLRESLDNLLEIFSKYLTLNESVSGISEMG